VEKAEAVVFLRNHEATSFGVHRDEASVFLLPVEGCKRILAWPPGELEAGEVRFASLDYEAHRGRALVMEGEPGDVLYWPSSHWHVGESVTPWSASISLGIRLHFQPVAEVLQHAMSLLRGQIGPDRIHTYPFDPGESQRAVDSLPAESVAALRAL